MNSIVRLLVITPLILLVALPSHAGDGLNLQPGDRVVWLGGTFFERMQAYGFGEAALVAGYADRDLTFRNLGWSGDNVFGEARALFGSVEDGFKRLENDVRQADPTVVIVNYGGNEAHAGTSGLANFAKGLNRLLDTLAAANARVIVLLPQPYEGLGDDLPAPAAYNQNLEIYRRHLRDVAQQRSLPVVDLATAIEAARADLPAGRSMTDNGVHLSPLGYRLVAPNLARALGARDSRWQIDLDPSRDTLEAVGCTIQKLNTSAGNAQANNAQATNVQFTVVDDVLELSQQSGYGSSPAVGQGTLRVRGLPPGNYALKIDGQPTQTASATRWSQGVRLTSRGGQQQAEQLRQAIVSKNRLHFYRYRPQNETYLFLFRKHEQGNNAVEIPQFDPLVEKQDARIAALRQAQPHQFELVWIQP